MSWSLSGPWARTTWHCWPTRPGRRVSALLAFFGHEGRFPSTKHEVPAAVGTHLATQVRVPAEAYLAYDWRGRARQLPQECLNSEGGAF